MKLNCVQNDWYATDEIIFNTSHAHIILFPWTFDYIYTPQIMHRRMPISYLFHSLLFVVAHNMHALAGLWKTFTHVVKATKILRYCSFEVFSILLSFKKNILFRHAQFCGYEWQDLGTLNHHSHNQVGSHYPKARGCGPQPQSGGFRVTLPKGKRGRTTAITWWFPCHITQRQEGVNYNMM